MWHWYPGHAGLGAGGWIGMGFMVLVWIAVIVAIVLLVRHLTARTAAHQGDGQLVSPGASQGWGQRDPSRPSALQDSAALRILEERYARGEIDQAEFLAKRADLTGGAR